MLTPSAILAAAVVARVLPPSPVEGYLEPGALAAKLAALDQEHGELCTLIEVGRTGEGRPIQALRLGKPSPDEGAPALLIVAGLDGSHLVGPEIAWRVAQKVAREHGELLADRLLYVIPAVNLDAVARTFAHPGAPLAGTPQPIDDDRDGVADEDGPEDLDGDGIVALMRIANPPPPAVPTLVADDQAPRLLRPADPLKGERPVYWVVTEGIDNDGDGLINEDGPGGVLIERNFMHRWPEFEPGAGAYPLSAPEALALARFVFAHPEIALGLTYGRHDNLVRAPDSRAMDVNPEVPQEIIADDAPVHAELARVFKETTGQTWAASAPGGGAGAFHTWLYAQRGVPSLATVVWGRPDVPEDPAAEGAEGDEADDGGRRGRERPDAAARRPGQQAGAGPPDAGARPGEGETPAATPPRRRRGGGAPPRARDAERERAERAAAALLGDIEEQRQWLALSDRARGKADQGAPEGDEGAAPSSGAAAPAGFIEWKPFDHPTLGAVEIGGFAPLHQIVPPVEELDALAEKQTAFVVELLQRLPTWTMEGPTAEPLADGLYRIRFAVRNDGRLPSRTAYARRHSIGDAFVVRLATPIDVGIAGRRVERLRSLEAGATQRFEWILRGQPGEPVTLVVRPPGGTDRTIEITLPSAQESNP